ncbi:HesA/MoeB/ThiF family protein [Muriicola soli]|uniref:Molybdopterin-synthase adenylyltransferase n=1 Tax=Muriicola soli TaxID=2507538 RepID=A0A411E9G0_9FLAO|nr:HesA/MoeB/ThiF family protein [Muriicola soli]QBA64174.1 sulfurtransferase [Muriicola soli]
MKSNRYIRQTSLKDFGPQRQQVLKESKVLVIGVGGLGIPVLQYLNAMGVGCLGMVEQDIVEWSNLQRQVLYSESDVGKPKIRVAEKKLRQMNRETELICHDTFLTKTNVLDIISDYDLVVDASDNFATRYLINDACVILDKPFVSGAIYGFEGQLSVFNYEDGPTYRCLFPIPPEEGDIPDCNVNGVLGVIPGIIGSLQALETVKVITSMPGILSGVLMLYNGLDQSVRHIKIPAQPKNKSRTQLETDYKQIHCDPVPEVSVENLIAQMSGNSGKFALIDIRSAEKFQSKAIDTAIHIPLEELEASTTKLAGKDILYFICQSGKRSREAVRRLQPLLQNHRMYSLKGGMNALEHSAVKFVSRDEMDVEL